MTRPREGYWVMLASGSGLALSWCCSNGKPIPFHCLHWSHRAGACVRVDRLGGMRAGRTGWPEFGRASPSHGCPTHQSPVGVVAVWLLDAFEGSLAGPCSSSPSLVGTSLVDYQDAAINGIARHRRPWAWPELKVGHTVIWTIPTTWWSSPRALRFL